MYFHFTLAAISDVPLILRHYYSLLIPCNFLGSLYLLRKKRRQIRGLILSEYNGMRKHKISLK
ncbi:hypothetical protein Syun_027757 [Stephania yunnanensis]|uniref:Uncharacterized protein n=1 Tax=Stephania yunnanensis TaxID=152371 RepID=A0AAP0EG73_9MAGN